MGEIADEHQAMYIARLGEGPSYEELFDDSYRFGPVAKVDRCQRCGRPGKTICGDCTRDSSLLRG